ncbi:uncharacterized protein LOC125028136 [Penaeus chinensis]|uniref:uncharacterized protein LOC125028136 n=1 Tax=Penaeus chinensis TaxID=139456 RepID=UPI001FB849A6|nr:uncharacterized protein LOC125028136 [Penaeus chinensis]XP_047473445.1 uncharacterized protein LOC125028136 [Penaeus chinensis]
MCEGYQFNLVFDFEWINGTLVPTVRPVLKPCPEDPRPIIAGVFLSLIFVGAFLLNMVVVVTVATSYTLKRFLYCHILINLCVTCMIDCIFNLTISIGYVTSAPWRFGYSMSFFNGFTINMLNSEMGFAVLLLAIDRLAAAKKYTRYLNLNECKIGLVIGFTWVVAFALASPIACGFIFSIPYRNRYSCSVADPHDDYYLIVHFILVVVFSTITLIVLMVITSVTFHRERRKQKKIKGNQTMGYFDQILMTPYFRTEFYPAVFSICITVAYLLLWLPFTVTTTIGPMISQHWANETTEESNSDSYSIFDPKDRDGIKRRAMLDESQLFSLNNTMSPNVTSEMASKMNNMTMNENLIPEVVDTPVSDTVFIWFRYIFDIVVPILVFIVLKDVRAKCESLIMCCRPNSVDVASPKPMRPPYLKQMSTPGTAEKESGSKPKKQKGSGKNTIGFKTPILFATSEGLHIRTVEETYLDMIDNKPLIGFSRQNTSEPVFTYDLCDVMLGYEDLTDFDGQYHIDDDDNYDRDSIAADLAQSNPVVMGANRAAMGQKPQIISEDEDDIPPDVEIRPPTPPKVQIVGNEPAVNLGDDVDVDAKRNKKGKKVVRFATMLNEEIPRLDSPDSSSLLDSSSASAGSSDSGIMADNERSSATPHDEDRKPRFSVNRSRNAQRSPAGSEPNPPPRRPQPPAKKGPSAPKKVIASKVRNIKSRHMQNMNGSLSSLEGQSAQAGRRFSKPGAKPESSSSSKNAPKR